MIKFSFDKETAIQTINSEITTLETLKDNLNESLTNALDIIQNLEGRVIITGMGKSGHVGKKIVASLASTGTSSFFIHPAEASHGDLGMITSKDAVIAISNSGESKELVDIVRFCKRFSVPLISITKNIQSTLAKASDVVLLLPNTKEACPLGLAPTSSSTATLVLGDVITVCLMVRKGFTKEDFNARHPGGKLGSILKRVSEIMHTGSELPLLNENANMQEALIEMSSKRLGCVGFINNSGNLVGILTDGDLRRKLNEQTFRVPVKDLITRTPITISKNMFTMEAINLMNDKKITNLFVLDELKPIGLVHIHDLLDMKAQ